MQINSCGDKDFQHYSRKGQEKGELATGICFFINFANRIGLLGFRFWEKEIYDLDFHEKGSVHRVFGDGSFLYLVAQPCF